MTTKSKLNDAGKTSVALAARTDGAMMLPAKPDGVMGGAGMLSAGGAGSPPHPATVLPVYGRIRSRAPLLTCGLIAIAFSTVGCNVFGPIAYMLGPRRIEKAEFTFATGPLGIFIEFARAGDEMPNFERELHDKLIEVFAERKISTNVVPYRDMIRLARDHRDFASWNQQQIARAVGADQLLYVRIMELRVRQSPDHPLLEPMCRVQWKVIDANTPARPRIWPVEDSSREVVVTRQVEEATTRERADIALAKLAFDTAQMMALPFYDVDLEERTPTAR